MDFVWFGIFSRRETEKYEREIVYSKMEISKRQAVRIFLIVYTCVGVVFFFLWTFVQTIRQYPFLETLFFVFLPAFLVFPYLIIEAIEERFSTKKPVQEV